MKKIIFLLSILVLLITNTAPVKADWSAQRRLFDSGVLHFDAETGAARCINDSVTLIGNDNAEKIYNFYLGKNLTPEQAAAIAGNAILESGANPNAVSRSGYRGIFQWDRNNRWPRLEEWTNSNGYDPQSLEGQLAFSYYEADQRGNIEGIRRHAELDMATWYWGRYYEGAIINGSRSEVPLTNVQKLDKRIEYAEQVISTYSFQSGLTTSSSSNCIGGNGQDTQYVDGFTVYSQYDPAWKDLPYASSTIGVAGCGPAAMAMIITNLTGQQVTPVDTANYAAQIGMYVPGVGSKWEIGPRLAAQWGLQSSPIANDISAITTALREGKLIIAPGQGAKPFTSGGHFIVIRGITADGKFRVGDSGHNDTSDKDWDPQFIIDNMREGGAYAIYQ